MEFLDRRIVFRKQEQDPEYRTVGKGVSFCTCTKDGPVPVICDCGEENDSKCKYNGILLFFHCFYSHE